MCFCFDNSSILNKENSGCDRQCAGNERQRCGGGGPGSNDIFTVFNGKNHIINPSCAIDHLMQVCTDITLKTQSV